MLILVTLQWIELRDTEEEHDWYCGASVIDARSNHVIKISGQWIKAAH